MPRLFLLLPLAGNVGLREQAAAGVPLDCRNLSYVGPVM